MITLTDVGIIATVLVVMAVFDLPWWCAFAIILGMVFVRLLRGANGSRARDGGFFDFDGFGGDGGGDGGGGGD